MKSAFFVALFAVNLLAAFAQSEVRCATPQKWQGSFREIDFDSGTGRFGNISYDAEIEAISVIEIERDAGDFNRRQIYQEVFLFQQKMSYRFDVSTGVCEGRQLTDTFRQFGAPYGSAYLGTNYIGGMTSGLGVKVDEYFMRREGDLSGSYAPLGTSSRECVPVLESFIRSSGGPAPSRSTNTHIQYLNIKPVGIFPPDTFAKPPQCN